MSRPRGRPKKIVKPIEEANPQEIDMHTFNCEMKRFLETPIGITLRYLIGHLRTTLSDRGKSAYISKDNFINTNAEIYGYDYCSQIFKNALNYQGKKIDAVMGDN